EVAAHHDGVPACAYGVDDIEFVEQGVPGGIDNAGREESCQHGALVPTDAGEGTGHVEGAIGGKGEILHPAIGNSHVPGRIGLPVAARVQPGDPAAHVSTDLVERAAGVQPAVNTQFETPDTAVRREIPTAIQLSIGRYPGDVEPRLARHATERSTHI